MGWRVKRLSKQWEASIYIYMHDNNHTTSKIGSEIPSTISTATIVTAASKSNSSSSSNGSDDIITTRPWYTYRQVAYRLPHPRLHFEIPYAMHLMMLASSMEMMIARRAGGRCWIRARMMTR